MAGGSCGSGGCGGCSSGAGSSSSSSGRRPPFLRFRNGKLGEKIARLPRPLRFFVFIAPFWIIGNSIGFVRRHYIPDSSMLPKAVEGTVVFGGAADGAVVAAPIAANASTTPAPATVAPLTPAAVVVPQSRSVFGHRTIPITDDAQGGAIVGYRFAQ